MSDLKSDSVPEIKSGFMVAASPLNSVKLELGIILIVGLFFSVTILSVVESQFLQVGFLGAYGLISMLWLILRVRRLMGKLASNVSLRKK